MNLSTFIIVLILLGISSLWIGRKAGKETKDREDYFLMGRKLGIFSLVMTLLATQIGGGALMGAAEEAYARGWTVLFYPLGMVLGMLILGLGYGAKIRKLNLTTIPEIFEKVYKSARLRQVASLLSIASLFFILVGQGIAARKFFFSIGFSGDLLFILFWLVLVLYTVMGGLRAVVKTDILQTTFIVIAFSLAIGVSFFRPETTELISAEASVVSTGAPWLTWLLMPLLFMLIEQDMGQRCFAAKSPRIVSLSAIIAGGFLLLISLVPIYFGTVAATMGVAIPEGGSVLVTAITALTNPVVSSIVVCAILMAVISTSDSLLCSLSSNIACDFPRLKASLLVSQGITFGVGMLTLALAFLFDNVVAMLMFSYSIAVSVLFVPVTLAVWKKNPHPRSAAIAMSVGGVSFLLLGWLDLSFPKELLTLPLAFGSFFANELISPSRGDAPASQSDT